METKIQDGFTDYAESKTDLLHDIMQAFEDEILSSHDFDAPSIHSFGDKVDNLIREQLLDYAEHVKKEDEKCGYDHEEQPGNGLNGSVTK